MEIFPFYLSRIHRPNRFVIPWHPVSYIIVDPWKLTEPPLSLCKINIEKAPEMHSLRLFVTCVRRFELPTPWSVAKCSIQLSYTHISDFKCRRPESNRYGRLGPQDFKSCASASSATPAFVNACKGINANYSALNGTYRARTYDPLLVRQMLSQLS